MTRQEFLLRMAADYVLRALPPASQAEWDAFVSRRPEGHLLQSWNWGEVKRDATWTPLRLGLFSRSGSELLAAAQVLRRTLPHVPPALGHLAYIPRGPVVDWSATTPEGTSLARLFLLQLRAYLRRHGALALHLEPSLCTDTPVASAALTVIQELGMRSVQHVQPLRTIALDLTPPEDALLAGMKEKWRYNVRLAGRKGVVISQAQSLDELRSWYELLQTTGERDHFGLHAFTYYRRAWELLAPHGQAYLLLARFQNELLAGIFVTVLGHEAIYLYGASGNAHRNLMPNYLLQWEAIRLARAAGATSYDFWGIPASDEPDEVLAGVYRFKSGWGGQINTFPGNFADVYHPLAVRVAERILGR